MATPGGAPRASATPSFRRAPPCSSTAGANINPAVSWALALTRKISPVRCLCYSVAQVRNARLLARARNDDRSALGRAAAHVRRPAAPAAQILGAIAGAGMVRIMTPVLFDAVSGGANQINPGSTSQEALGVEFGCTFLLVLTVMAAVDSGRAEKVKHIGAIAPIVVGLAVTAAHFIAIPVDNCSINPARSFGVSVVSGSWKDHWIFWFGPYLGSTGAALMYGYVFQEVDVHAPPSGKDSADGVAPQRLVEDAATPLPARTAPAAASAAAAAAGAPAGSLNPAFGVLPAGKSVAMHTAPEASAAFTSDGGQEWR